MLRRRKRTSSAMLRGASLFYILVPASLWVIHVRYDQVQPVITAPLVNLVGNWMHILRFASKRLPSEIVEVNSSRIL